MSDPNEVKNHKDQTNNNELDVKGSVRSYPVSSKLADKSPRKSVKNRSGKSKSEVAIAPRIANSTTSDAAKYTKLRKNISQNNTKPDKEKEKTAQNNIDAEKNQRKVNFLRRGIQNMRLAFSNNSGMEKSVRRAQEKQASLAKALSTDCSDDTLWGGQDYAEEEEDNVEVFNDINHRSDLILIRNNDNNGKLHNKGVPFWKAPIPAKDKPPVDKKLLSNMLADVAAGKVQLKEGIPDPEILDEFQDLTNLEKRDKRYFTSDQILTNTIRTIVHSLEPEPDENSAKKTALPPVIDDAKITITEPHSYISYQRHHYMMREPTQFKKSGVGVCKKSKKKKGAKGGDGSSSGSSSSSTSDSAKGPKQKSARLRAKVTKNKK